MLTEEVRTAKLTALGLAEEKIQDKKTAALFEYAAAQGMTSAQTSAFIALESAGVSV
jgi:hypothetical protein